MQSTNPLDTLQAISFGIFLASFLFLLPGLLVAPGALPSGYSLGDMLNGRIPKRAYHDEQDIRIAGRVHAAWSVLKWSLAITLLLGIAG